MRRVFLLGNVYWRAKRLRCTISETGTVYTYLKTRNSSGRSFVVKQTYFLCVVCVWSLCLIHASLFSWMREQFVLRSSFSLCRNVTRLQCFFKFRSFCREKLSRHGANKRRKITFLLLLFLSRFDPHVKSDLGSLHT